MVTIFISDGLTVKTKNKAKGLSVSMKYQKRKYFIIGLKRSKLCTFNHQLSYCLQATEVLNFFYQIPVRFKFV